MYKNLNNFRYKNLNNFRYKNSNNFRYEHWDLYHSIPLVEAVKSLAPSKVIGHGGSTVRETSPKIYGVWPTPVHRVNSL